MQSISSIQTDNEKGPYTSIALYLLGVILCGIMVFFGGKIVSNFDKLKSRSAVTIDSLNQPAEVFINDKSVGTTPFESKNIDPGENKITLKTNNQMYETKINFLADDNSNIYNVVIFRDLGTSNVFSSGQEFWYEKGTGNEKVKIISNPTGASVYIDNTEVGKTPFSSTTLSPGDYNIKISQEGYETQEMKITTDKKYTVNVNVKLFPLPIPSKVEKFEGSDNLYALYTSNNAVLSNTQTWVDTIIYWNKTKGITIDNEGKNKELVFDYFLDYKGNLFNKEGKLTTADQINKISKGAYLGNLAEGEGLSERAKQIYMNLTNQTVTSGRSATVLETGTGWLRVRSGPSVGSSEVQKVNVGEKYDVLDEQNGWIKLKLNDNVTGWAIKDYLSIK